MKKKLIITLVIIALLLALGAAGTVGFLWYRDNHVFVDGDAYPMDTRYLDLTDEDISIAYYDELQEKLPFCDIVWAVPFQGRRIYNTTEEIAVSALSLEDVELLEAYFPNLKTVDAAQSTDYAVLEVLQERLPEVKVVYAVSLGGESYAPGITDIALSNGDYDFVTLMENLTYLRNLKTVTLRMPELTQEQMDQLKAKYETITFTSTVEILGQEYDVQTTQLDLSAMTTAETAAVAEKLSALPNLEDLELMTADGTSNLTKADVKVLMEAVPNAVIHYSFEYQGYTISTADEEVHIQNKKIGEEGLPEVREILDIMTNCSRFVLENCQISNESMAQLREDYREKTKVVWRVSYGKGSTLTDAEVIRAVYDLVDDNCNNLVYCEDAKYMDIGHNEWLDACDFVSGMKSLEYVIISGAPIKSLEPFRSCKNLRFLEIAFCEYLEDVSPLADCTSLEMLNISNTHIVDLSPLDSLSLTTLVARRWLGDEYGSGDSRVPVEEQARFIAANPNCKSYFSDKKNPYGEGWRYTEDGKDYLPQYKVIRTVFRLAQDPNIPNHVGWYLKDEERTTVAEQEAILNAAQTASTEETQPEETIAEAIAEE